MSKYFGNTLTHISALLIALLAITAMGAANVVKAAETGARGIRVVIDGESTYYQTTDKTVGEFLANENIAVSEEDIINYDMDAEIESSMRIVIDKPFEVEVSVDGGEYTKVVTNAETIGKLIVQLRDDAAEVDYQTAEGFSSSTKLAAGAKISLLSVTTKTFTKTEKIDFETVEVDNDELYIGETNVAQEGVAGEKVITMKSVYIGGNLSTTYSTDSMVTKLPINKIVENGTKEKPVEVPVEEIKQETENKSETKASSNTSDKGFSYKSVVTMSATAYCPCSTCCGSGAKGITANGMRAGYGVVAVDKKVIPLGTKLYIEGYGYAIAADTGSAIKGNRIDLCFNTHYSALKAGYGHTPVKVYILN